MMLNAGSNRQPGRAGVGGQGSVSTPSEPFPLPACIQRVWWVAQTDIRTMRVRQAHNQARALRQVGVIAHVTHRERLTEAGAAMHENRPDTARKSTERARPAATSGPREAACKKGAETVAAPASVSPLRRVGA